MITLCEADRPPPEGPSASYTGDLPLGRHPQRGLCRTDGGGSGGDTDGNRLKPPRDAPGAFLPGGTDEVGGDDIGRVPVQAATGATWWSGERRARRLPARRATGPRRPAPR